MPNKDVTEAKLQSLVSRGIISVEQKLTATANNTLENLVAESEAQLFSIVERNLQTLIDAGLANHLLRRIPQKALVNLASKEVMTLLQEQRISVARALEFTERDLLKLHVKIDCILADHISIDYCLGLSAQIFDLYGMRSPRTITHSKCEYIGAGASHKSSPDRLQLDASLESTEEDEEESTTPPIVEKLEHLKMDPKKLELSPSDVYQTPKSTTSSYGVTSVLRFGSSISDTSVSDLSPSVNQLTPRIGK